MQDQPTTCACGCGETPPIATRTYSKLGVFKGQPLRFRPYHHNRKAGAPAVLNPDRLTARIPLAGRDGAARAHTLIDAADAAWASQWRWCLNGGYARRAGASKLHRELLGLVKGDGVQVDHINRDRLDNRRANLRIATHSGNMQNTPSHAGTSSRYRGVSWHKSHRAWQAYLSVGGRRRYLGHFKTENEAAEAAREARARLMPFATD